MRIFLTINLIFLMLNGRAQNLIPNAGFEEKNIDAKLQWKQPQGEYYHYQEGSATSGLSHTGNYFNGICMYNYQENEYLSIQLKSPLQKDQQYCASFFVRLYDGKKENYELTDKIGWYFSEQNIPSDNLISLEVLPQIIFTLNDTLLRTNWQLVQNTFVATGKERYLTVGYFNSLGLSKKFNKQEKDNFLGITAVKTEQKEVLSYNTEKNKKNKNKKKDLEKFRNQLNQQSNKKPPTQISTRDIFSVRYYFDDFCLIPSDQSCSCETSKLEIKIGEDFVLKNILFETNSSILLPIAMDELNMLTDYLLLNNTTNIKIKGHTDNEGNQDANLKLSRQRAESVKEFFVTKGINPIRISTQGFGFGQPVDKSNTDEAKSKNRRVEFEVVVE